MTFLRKAASIAVRLIAGILAACLFFGLLAACITGSLLAVDFVRHQGGETYAGVELKALSWLKGFVRQRKGYSARDQIQYLSNQLISIRDSQLQTDEMMLRELDSDAYSLENPLIVNDPYGLSPLTALLLFKTREPQKMAIHVAGDTPLAEVDYAFEGYNTEHILPVYGLYPGRENEVTLTARKKDGDVQTVHLSIEADQLPDSLAHETVRCTLLNEAAYQPGFTFTFRGNNSQVTRAALDVNGVYRWCLDLKGTPLLSYARPSGNYNGGNSVFMAVGNNTYGTAGILEFNLLGKLLNAWYTPYGVHHDIEVTDDCLWVAGSTDEKTKENMIYCLDRHNGELLDTIEYEDILQPYRNQTQHYPDIDNFYSMEDWAHINSVDLHNGNLVISSRHQSTVVCNDVKGGIKWMLCDPTDYHASYRRYMLTPVGEDFLWPYTQHAADVLPDQDGDRDTVDILLFDNGDFRLDDSEKASRMVQYRINEAEMTVEQVWAWGGDENELYSYRHGDADLLPNGNRLGSFEPYDEKAKLRYAYGIEVDSLGEPVWEVVRTSKDDAHEYGEYRLERLHIYAGSANDLSVGRAANLFIPDNEE